MPLASPDTTVMPAGRQLAPERGCDLHAAGRGMARADDGDARRRQRARRAAA